MRHPRRRTAPMWAEKILSRDVAIKAINSRVEKRKTIRCPALCMSAGGQTRRFGRLPMTIAVGTRVTSRPPHRSVRAPIRAYGLYGAFFVKGASRHFGRPLHSILLFDPRREHSSVPTAYCHRRRAQRRARAALLQRPRRLVLDGGEPGGRPPPIGWLAAAGSAGN